jgi:hypothetical protein
MNGARLLLTDKDSISSFDSEHIFATGGLGSRITKVTLNNVDENDFRKMAYDKKYATKIYKMAAQALIDSHQFNI